MGSFSVSSSSPSLRHRTHSSLFASLLHRTHMKNARVVRTPPEAVARRKSFRFNSVFCHKNKFSTYFCLIFLYIPYFLVYLCVCERVCECVSIYFSYVSGHKYKTIFGKDTHATIEWTNHFYSIFLGAVPISYYYFLLYVLLFCSATSSSRLRRWPCEMRERESFDSKYAIDKRII